MATRRRAATRPATRRTPAKRKGSLPTDRFSKWIDEKAEEVAKFILALPFLLAALVAWFARETWAEMAHETRKQLGGFVLAAVAILAATVGRFALADAFGAGSPLVILALLAAGVALIHPPWVAGVQRYQMLAAGVGALAVVGLLGLGGWGGSVGGGLEARLAGSLGRIGAGLALVGLLGVSAAFASGVGAAALAGHAMRPALATIGRSGLLSRLPWLAKATAAAEPSAEVPVAAADAALVAQAEEAIEESPTGDEPGAALNGHLAPRPVLPGSPVPDTLPSPSLLESPAEPVVLTAEERATLKKRVEGTLADIGIKARVPDIVDAPSSLLIALELAPGQRPAKLRLALDDLKVALGSEDMLLRLPIPGTSYVGLETPKERVSLVRLRAVIESPEFRRMRLPLALGAGRGDQPILVDLAGIPHATVGGETGGGKSVCLNALILGLVMRHGPAACWLVLIDPKQGAEFGAYAHLPHLAMPVITDATKAQPALEIVAEEVERRYALMAATSSPGNQIKSLADYNAWAARNGAEPMPYIVVVVDELSDLMSATEGEIEGVIVRLAQKARAAGVHLLLATQSPRREVMTGLIKTNVPGRIAFKVPDGTNSRIILDRMGAEQLAGRGDMLVTAGPLTMARMQCAFPSDRDIEAVVGYWTERGGPGFFLAPSLRSEADGPDPMFARAARKVAQDGRPSSAAVLRASLQGALDIPAWRAERLVRQLADYAVIGATNGSQVASVLMDGEAVDGLLEGLGVEG